MALIFSTDAAWGQTTKSGFRQKVFVMYHSTNDPRNVSNILNYGFNISKGSHLLLGDGLYVSRDIEKTVRYGPVCFKLLVYLGKTLGVEKWQDPMRQAWQEEYSSAWVPPDCGLGGRKEMTCVKSSAHVRIRPLYQ